MSSDSKPKTQSKSTEPGTLTLGTSEQQSNEFKEMFAELMVIGEDKPGNQSKEEHRRPSKLKPLKMVAQRLEDLLGGAFRDTWNEYHYSELEMDNGENSVQDYKEEDKEPVNL